MKRILVLFIIFNIAIFTPDVFAKSYYYKNSYGVTFTQEEYDFISKFYFEGYQNYMTNEELQEIHDKDMLNRKLTIVESKMPDYIPYGVTEYTYVGKRLKLTSACDSNVCDMTSTVEWNNNPSIRSHDLLGVIVENTSILKRNESYLYFDNEIRPVYSQNQGNAFSSTYKLPIGNGKINILEEFTVKNSGKVITSYQHAVQNISEPSSRNYIFRTDGCGGVFVFHQNIRNYYECMYGIYLLLG